jgi:hypothetical protein
MNGVNIKEIWVFILLSLCYSIHNKAECGKHSAIQLAWMGISLLSVRTVKPTYGAQPWGGFLLSHVVIPDVC